MNEKERPKITREQKAVLFNLILFSAMGRRGRGSSWSFARYFHPVKMQVDYCLQALGERFTQEDFEYCISIFR